MKIPNSLTILRILLIPVFVVVFYLPYSWSFIASSVIFVLAGITDWLDGYLARKLNQTTPFGAFLDPVADKLMVVIALVLLVNLHDSPWFSTPALIIIGREIVISALREWMADIGKRTSVAVSYVGKVKTALQMVAIVVLLAVDPFKGGGEYSNGLILGYCLLYSAAILTLWSMIAYLKAAWPDLTASVGNGGDK
jgi:CDP-diacylglycerol--glycerol-3-phosphate 3-phosphatidyltransferase